MQETLLLICEHDVVLLPVESFISVVH